MTWTARAALALVFAIAGVAKMRDHASAQTTVRAFAVPAAMASPVATGVSVLELAIGLGLLVGPIARLAAGAAAVLLAVFIVGLSAQLARGHTVPCACFGRLSSAPVTWRTLGRNAVLIAGAVYLVTAR